MHRNPLVVFKPSAQLAFRAPSTSHPDPPTTSIDRSIDQAGAPKRLVRTRTVAIGLGVPAAGLVLLRLAPSFHSAMAVATLGAACAGLGPKAGWLANILDVAPNHAGLIAGFTTMVSAIPAIIAANATSTQLQIELLEGQLGGWMITVAGSILLIAAAVIFNLGCGDEAILR